MKETIRGVSGVTDAEWLQLKSVAKSKDIKIGRLMPWLYGKLTEQAKEIARLKLVIEDSRGDVHERKWLYKKIKTLDKKIKRLKSK